MKVALLVLTLLFSCCMCYAQQPENRKKADGLCDDDNCLRQEFPYIFCNNTGELVVKCSDDPNNERGLKFMKVKVPIDFTYLDWTMQPEITRGSGVIKFYLGQDTNFTAYPVFVNASMKNIIATAAKRWSTPDLCPPQGPDDEYQDCQITVRWSLSNDDFNINTMLENPAVTRRAHDPGNCSVHCPSSAIVLNQQPAYLRLDDYGRPTHFIATERNNYGYIPPEPNYVYIDAYTALVHEFGHLLGFAHTDEAPCGDPNGIMKPKWNSREIGDLTWADKCMFLKAYCCKKTQTVVWFEDPQIPPPGPPINHTKPLMEGSNDNNLEISFSVAPNPVTSGTITLSLHGMAGLGVRSIQIIDATGNAVLAQQLAGENTREVSLDVSALSNGLYIMQLIQGEQVYSRKFLISE